MQPPLSAPPRPVHIFALVIISKEIDTCVTCPVTTWRSKFLFGFETGQSRMRNDSYIAETSFTFLRCFRFLLVAKSNVLGQASSKYGRFPVRASGVLPANQKHVPCLVCRLEEQGLQGYPNPGPASKSPIYGRFPPAPAPLRKIHKGRGKYTPPLPPCQRLLYTSSSNFSSKLNRIIHASKVGPWFWACISGKIPRLNCPIETAPIKCWILSVWCCCKGMGGAGRHLVSPDGRTISGPYAIVWPEPISLALLSNTAVASYSAVVDLVDFWLSRNHSIFDQMCFQCAQSSQNYPITQHDWNFMFS